MPNLKDFENNLTGTWNEHSCAVLWTFLGIALLWDWNENSANAEFSKFACILSAAL